MLTVTGKLGDTYTLIGFALFQYGRIIDEDGFGDGRVLASGIMSLDGTHRQAIDARGLGTIRILVFLHVEINLAVGLVHIELGHLYIGQDNLERVFARVCSCRIAGIVNGDVALAEAEDTEAVELLAHPVNAIHLVEAATDATVHHAGGLVGIIPQLVVLYQERL